MSRNASLGPASSPLPLHALVTRRSGIEIEEIDLWLLGGVSKMRGEAHALEDELRYAVAGAAVTLGVFGALALALPPPPQPG